MSLTGGMALPTWALFYSIGTALWAFYQAYPDPNVAVLLPDAVFPNFILHELPPGATHPGTASPHPCPDGLFLRLNPCRLAPPVLRVHFCCCYTTWGCRNSFPGAIICCAMAPFVDSHVVSLKLPCSCLRPACAQKACTKLVAVLPQADRHSALYLLQNTRNCDYVMLCMILVLSSSANVGCVPDRCCWHGHLRSAGGSNEHHGQQPQCHCISRGHRLHPALPATRQGRQVLPALRSRSEPGGCHFHDLQRPHPGMDPNGVPQ